MEELEVSGKKVETNDEINKSVDKCEFCLEDDKTTKADGVCQECRQFMCQACFKDHLKVRLCRNHILVDSNQFPNLNEKNEDNSKCEKHSTESVRFYCRNHNVTGCGDCMLHDHKFCEHKYIRDIAKEFPESMDFKAFKEKLDSSVVKVNDCLNSASSKKLLVAELERKAKEKIKQFRTDIDSYLNKAEKEILAKLKECASEHNAHLSNYETEMSALKKETEEVKSQVDAGHGFPLFKLAVKHQKIPDKIAKKIALANAQIDLGDFEFVANKKLQQFILQISTSKLLGCILKRSSLDFQEGDRVCRGKDWKWDNEDGNGYGTIVSLMSGSPGWAEVTWDNNTQERYRIGAEKCYDLKRI